LRNLTNWLTEIISQVGIIPIAITIGNKVDLRKQSNDAVSKQIGDEFVKLVQEKYLDNTYNVPFFETSALTGVNVELALIELVEIIYIAQMI